MSRAFKEILENRRSYYNITDETTISKEKIIEIVEHSTRHVPSAFNSQSQRALVLFDQYHEKFWAIVMETLRKKISKEKFASTEKKIDSFAAGFGTILYFDDQKITQNLMERFPKYKENFHLWSHQSNGMLQFAIWTQLEAEGLGVNIQHYNPIIDEEVKEVFQIPDEWDLIAQMPFGKPTAQPGEKEFIPIEERVKVYE